MVRFTHHRMILWLLAMVFLTPSLHAGERPTHFGVSLAYPVKVPHSFSRQNISRFIPESITPLTVKVDTEGIAREIGGPASTDSLFLSIFRPFIDSLKFEPGLVDGKRVEQVIPFQLHYSLLRMHISFNFPVDTARNIMDPDLYFYALELNGVESPAIEYFPPYFYRPTSADTPGVCPYVLAKITLDSTGDLISIQRVNSGPSSFAEQVLTAANWARFHPAYIDGVPHASDPFLVVTFLPGVAYPTIPVDSQLKTPNVYDRVRVRLYADTVGLMLKPVAANPGYDGVYVVGDNRIPRFDTALASVRIDTLGTATFLEASGCPSKVFDALAQLLPGLRFVPAVDFSGRPREWQGLMTAEYVDSTKIRIDYTWFPGVRFFGH